VSICQFVLLFKICK